MHKSMHKSISLSTGISNPRLLDALSLLVELDLLACNQALLQRATDANGSHGSLEAHRRRDVIQTAGCELVGLSDEGLAEPAVVVRRDFASNATRLIDVDQVRCRLCVNSEFACGAGDFSGCPVSMQYGQGIEGYNGLQSS